MDVDERVVEVSGLLRGARAGDARGHRGGGLQRVGEVGLLEGADRRDDRAARVLNPGVEVLGVELEVLREADGVVTVLVGLSRDNRGDVLRVGSDELLGETRPLRGVVARLELLVGAGALVGEGGDLDGVALEGLRAVAVGDVDDVAAALLGVEEHVAGDGVVVDGVGVGVRVLAERATLVDDDVVRVPAEVGVRLADESDVGVGHRVGGRVVERAVGADGDPTELAGHVARGAGGRDVADAVLVGVVLGPHADLLADVAEVVLVAVLVDVGGELEDVDALAAVDAALERVGLRGVDRGEGAVLLPVLRVDGGAVRHRGALLAELVRDRDERVVRGGERPAVEGVLVLRGGREILGVRDRAVGDRVGVDDLVRRGGGITGLGLGVLVDVGVRLGVVGLVGVDLGLVVGVVSVGVVFDALDVGRVLVGRGALLLLLRVGGRSEGGDAGGDASSGGQRGGDGATDERAAQRQAGDGPARAGTRRERCHSEKSPQLSLEQVLHRGVVGPLRRTADPASTRACTS